MSIHEHLSTFAGLGVCDFQHEHEGESPADHYSGEEEPGLPGEAAWRVGSWFDGPALDDVFAAFLDRVDTTEITHLVIGYWGVEYDDGAVDPVPLLAGAADRLPNLRALFLGDIVMEQSEISWIGQSDITPLFTAFPNLEHLGVRGGSGLAVQPFRGPALKTLRFETGGLPAGVVRAVGASDLPVLEHLDLWLGTANYGGDATVDDLAPILGGERLPSLRHLGLEDSEIQDEIAAAVAGAPIVARLESLSLAMGTLTDLGAESLLSGQPLTHLKRLDLHHHFLTDPVVERLRAALPEVELNVGDRQRSDRDWRYVAVSE
ncbi:STM4015 family protein [Spirillospora sp. CA-255316]